MIKFGTSGWRAVMGEEFTFANVRLVVQAIANYLREAIRRPADRRRVNYDTRFLSERYANEAAKILSHNQIHVLLADRDAPAQAQALQIIRRQAQAGINFTASFNPPEYNGLKLNLETGAPALPERNRQGRGGGPAPVKCGSGLHPVLPADGVRARRSTCRSDYLEFIQKKIDFAAIQKSGTPDRRRPALRDQPRVPGRDPGGQRDPGRGDPRLCRSLFRRHRALLHRGRTCGSSAGSSGKSRCNLGLATDADGDRFGILDQNGALRQSRTSFCPCCSTISSGSKGGGAAWPARCPRPI